MGCVVNKAMIGLICLSLAEARPLSSLCLPKESITCPRGEFAIVCADDGLAECVRCKNDTYSPNETRFGDRCRIKKSCQNPFMYAAYSTQMDLTRDTECVCDVGFEMDHRLEVCIQYSSDTKLNGKTRTVTRKVDKSMTDFRASNNSTIAPEDKAPDKSQTPVVISIVVGCISSVLCCVLLVLYLKSKGYNCPKRNHRDSHPNSIRAEKVLLSADENVEYNKQAVQISRGFISNNLPQTFMKELSRQLFGNDIEYEHIAQRSPDDLKEIKVGIIKDWREQKGDRAKLRVLYNALKKCNARSTADGVCKAVYQDLGDGHTGSKDSDQECSNTPAEKRGLILDEIQTSAKA